MKKWEKLMEKIDDMVEQGKGTLYERVKILSEVYDDPQFNADIVEQKGNATELLNSKVNDLWVRGHFMDLYQMFKMFPKKEEWVKGDLQKMQQQMLIKLVEESRQKKNGKQTVTVVNGKPVVTITPKTEEELEKEKIKKETVQSWKERALAAEQRIRELEAEIRFLKRENRDIKILFKKSKAA